MNENDNYLPASECCFTAEVELRRRDNDEQKSTPFTAIARTGDALNHAYWGRVVHDLAGMQHKSRIPIDFNHDPSQIVGYANKFNTESGDLEIKGALTPSKHEEYSRSQEIIDKYEQGVPWEMSISFPGDLEIERVAEGEQVTVNQREFTGPLTVIRSWSLRGVAVTPYGHDAQTSLQFSNDQIVNYTVITKETEMSEEQAVAEAEVEVKVDEAVDTTDNDTVEAEVAVDTEPEKEEELKLELAEPITGHTYMAMFGRVQGALYFAEGLSIEEATAKELQRLQAENAELKAKAQDADGLEEAVGFSQSEGGEIDSNVLTAVPAERMAQVIE